MMKKIVHLLLTTVSILAFCSCSPVKIESTPSGASVYDNNGVLVGKTPYTTELFISPRDYTIKKDNFIDQSVSLNSDSPRQIALKLERKVVIVYSIPTAEIYVEGSDTPIGTAPMELYIPDQPVNYVLKLTNYYDQSLTISSGLTEPQIFEMKLRPFVTITTDPVGAEIYENGTLIGKSSFRDEITTARTFELKKSGYYPKTFTISEAPPYDVTLSLEPFPVITIETTPENAEVYRDNKLLSQAPLELAVGKKITVEVRAARHYPRTVDISPNSPSPLRVNLTPVPYVTINSDPSGAEVFINGESIGSTPVEHLIEKETTVELFKEGYLPQKTTLTGKNTKIEVVLTEVPPAPVAPVVEATQTVAEVKKAVAPAPAPAPVPAKPVKKEPTFPWVAILIGGVVAVALFFVVSKRKK